MSNKAVTQMTDAQAPQQLSRLHAAASYPMV